MVATRASLKVQFGWTLWLGDRGGSSNKFPVPACDKWVVRGTKAEEVQCRGRWGGGWGSVCRRGEAWRCRAEDDVERVQKVSQMGTAGPAYKALRRKIVSLASISRSRSRGQRATGNGRWTRPARANGGFWMVRRASRGVCWETRGSSKWLELFETRDGGNGERSGDASFYECPRVRPAR